MIPIKFDCLPQDPDTGLLKDETPCSLVYCFTRHGVHYYGLTTYVEKIDGVLGMDQDLSVTNFQEIIMMSQREDDSLEYMQIESDDFGMLLATSSKSTFYGSFDFTEGEYERWQLPEMDGQPAALVGQGMVINVVYGQAKHD